MTRWLKWLLVVTGCALFGGAVALGWYVFQAGPVASGFVAKYLCSSTFVSRRDPAVVFEQEVTPVNPIASHFTYSIDGKMRSVTASFGGLFSRKAIFREGCGCTLVVGVAEEAIREQRIVSPDFNQKRPRHRKDRPWPQGNSGPVNPTEVGADAEKLKAALDDAFAEPFQDKRRNTRAVVVVYKGRLIAERYAGGVDRQTASLGWSMSKSVTNALAGILVQGAQLDIMQPVDVPEWRGHGQKAKITLDHLLRMSSGLQFEEVYKPLYDATRMLYASPGFAAYAAAKPMEAEPNHKWHYSSGTSNIVARILRRRMEKVYPYYLDYIYERMFHRIGMYSAIMEPDAAGTFVGSSYTLATALDWARFGLLYLQDGVWQGERILPAGWVAYSTTPTGGAPKGQYGAHFWLNRGSLDDPHDRRWPHAPRDAFGAMGYQDQRVIIIPSHKAVLVRFGATTDRQAWDTDAFIQQVLAALPHQ